MGRTSSVRNSSYSTTFPMYSEHNCCMYRRKAVKGSAKPPTVCCQGTTPTIRDENQYSTLRNCSVRPLLAFSRWAEKSFPEEDEHVEFSLNHIILKRTSKAHVNSSGLDVVGDCSRLVQKSCTIPSEDVR